jgi:Fanconi-associated nuclease 1
MLDVAIAQLAGVQLAGARWDRFSPGMLRELVLGIDGPSLSAVLRCFAEDYRASRRGMPDLCVLPGPAIKLPGALPGTIPEGMLLAEVKGPGDSLRDEQRVWMDRLLELGVPTELWKVRRKKPAQKLRPKKRAR